MRKLIFLLPILLVIAACNEPPEQVARDVIAGGTAALRTAQTIYAPQCQADSKGQSCVLINQAIYAHGLAVTALETYCGFQLTPVPAEAQCKPVKSALPALQTTITNLHQLIAEINAMIGAK
jgi:hypothetical protein